MPSNFAQGQSVGGQHPEPPIHDYPLLAWMPDHPTFGGDVFTEDGKASVPMVLEAFQKYRDRGDIFATADELGTTANHVIQALAYAERAAKGKG